MSQRILPSSLRSLTDSDVSELISNGCDCADWSRIRVGEKFDTSRVKHTSFLGDVVIGSFTDFVLVGGQKRKSGLYRAKLHNCVVCDNAFVSETADLISNYVIGCGTSVVNVGRVVANGDDFGEGTDIAVINENGGRSVPLSAYLTAQTAYLCSMYRDNKDFFTSIYDIINKSKASADMRNNILCATECEHEYDFLRGLSFGFIGSGVSVFGVRDITNVMIDDGAIVEGCSYLRHGVVISSVDSPARLLDDVRLSSFVVRPGSKVASGATIERGFVGDNVTVELGFTAIDTMMFACSHFACGEAVSLFAGPFTVSHHKSSLLIAGMLSFFNAGSATNQSNHYYRMGPNHEGKLCRGSKTASGAYLLWPAVSGVYSLVKGKHTANLDTRSFPYSFLIEKEGDTWIYPGMALRSAGTARDIKKWENRDYRKPYASIDSLPIYLDNVNFDADSPFVINYILEGIKVLSSKDVDKRKTGCNYVKFGKAKVNFVSVEMGLDLYRLALSAFVGETLSSMKNRLGDSFISFFSKVDLSAVEEKWVDMSGMYCTSTSVSNIISKVKSGTLASLDDINAELYVLNSEYEGFKDRYVAALVLRRYFFGSSEMVTEEAISGLVMEGEESRKKLNAMIASDRQREYFDAMSVGYGFDGTDVNSDFSAVQGIDV